MLPRIVVVSEDLVEPWDEGIKKFAFSIGRAALGAGHPVRMINVDRSGLAAARGGVAHRGAPSVETVAGTRTFAQRALRRELVSFQPEIVVYVPSPSATVGSFLRAFVLRRHWPRARHAMVALLPRRHPPRLKPLLRRLAPDVVFVSSYASLLHLSDLSLRADVVPVGVDLDLHRPARDGERAALRRAHGVPEDAFVFLHVGHLNAKRNLGSLARLPTLPGALVIVVGGTSTPDDRGLRAQLEAAGARVIHGPVPVDEYYRMADAYVFPVIDCEGSTEIPLSVVEALAQGLPVIARPFGGLRDFVAPGDDVRYFESDDEMLAHARSLQGGPRPRVRDMEDFGWRRVAERIVSRLSANGASSA
jgi:glycosyltransferase involved in cell wall biosynthesis